MDNVLHFPIFRKLNNDHSYYKIVSLEEFYELQLLGSKVLEHHILARQYPEKLRILDMIDFATPYIDCTEEEYKKHAP